MNRRVFIGTLAGGLLAAPVAAEAQNVPRIGVLVLFGAAPTPGQPNVSLDAFRGGLRGLGYVEGQNVIIEYRWGEGQAQRLADLAADLVRHKVAVIVAAGTPATLAAKAVTSTIPIVMTNVGDPVGSGIVASLASPGPMSQD